MVFIEDYIEDWSQEIGRDQVILCYIPSISRDSFLHVAFWKGSFDVRNYLKSGSAKLRDRYRLKLSDLISGASPYILRVKGRVSVNEVKIWKDEVMEANNLYLKTAKQSMGNKGGNLNTSDNKIVRAFRKNVIPHWYSYGITEKRAARLENNLNLMNDLYSYGNMKEDSSVIFYFILMDLTRQIKMNLHQRNSSGNLRDFKDIFKTVNNNNSYGDTLLTQLAPFKDIDPYKYFITFELQLNNNYAIGNPAVKTNQADIVITDVENKKLYVIEAKLSTELNDYQLENALTAIEDLTVKNRSSVFHGFNGKLIVLDVYRDKTFGNIDVITWEDIIDIIKKSEDKIIKTFDIQ